MNSVLFILGWIVCGFLSYGLLYGFFRRQYEDLDYRTDRRFCLFIALHGTIALFAALIMIPLVFQSRYSFKIKGE